MPDHEEFSCIPKAPLIELDKDGVAPIVKYTMPHETSYSAKSFIPLAVERDCFKEEHRKTSNVDSWARFKDKDIEEIAEILHAEFTAFKTSQPVKNTKYKIPMDMEMKEINETMNDLKKEMKVTPVLNRAIGLER